MTSVEPQVDENQLVRNGPVHELSSYWTLWTHVSTAGNKKKRALGPLFDFNCVEDFWVVYNSLRSPTEFTGRHDIIFMRSQLNPDIDEVPEAEQEQQKFNRVQPEWEDANNLGGGEFRLVISSDSEIASKQWELTLLAVLGGSLPLSEEICGVWLGIGRKGGSTVSLWQRTPDEQTPADAVEQVAKAWAQLLHTAQVPVNEISYTSHQASLDAVANNQNPKKQSWTSDELVAPSKTL